MKNFNLECLTIGLAMFAMFFGAGNIIFPLAIGMWAGDSNIFAVLGLIITAVIMPFAGVIAIILFDGDYKRFFGRLGVVPGFILALTIMALLGPLGSTPRCIALSCTTLKNFFPSLHCIGFSAIFCLLLFLCALSKNRMMALLGKVLTPLLLAALSGIVILGLWTGIELPQMDRTAGDAFIQGIKEGYNTMDLLAAFFFSSAMFMRIKSQYDEQNGGNPFSLILCASFIGAILLALVYIGFSYLAAYHGQYIEVLSKDALLAAIAMKIAGPFAGVLVCTAIALACFTTALALISVFAEFAQKELFRDKLGYTTSLALSIVITFCISTFEFTGISHYLVPVLQFCYPGLIVLTITNIGYGLGYFTSVKFPVAIAFLFSAWMML